MPKLNDKQQKEEYNAILDVFEKYLETIDSKEDNDDIIEGLMALTAEFFVKHACSGFDIDYEDALELVKKQEGLTEEEKTRRTIIVAAIENLIDFAVAKEYQMIKKLPENDNEGGYEEGGSLYEEALDICDQYNNNYMCTEDLDIEDAMAIAAGLISIDDRAVLTYETQNDDRVRPWHAQYEGFSAPKFAFPDWLIPPIEHGCRCFLVDDSGDAVMRGDLAGVKDQTVRIPQMPDWFNKTFKESVAKGGRIFSDEHPYFTIDKADMDMLTKITTKIKERYFGNG